MFPKLFLKDSPLQCVPISMTQSRPNTWIAVFRRALHIIKSWLSPCVLVIFGTVAAPCPAQQVTTAPPPTPYSVISRTSSERVWQRTVYQPTQGGQAIPQTQQFTELSDGVCYLKNGQWCDSQPEIVILPDGSAIATNSPCQVLFPPDLGDGMLNLISPDGMQIQLVPAALCYDDGSNTVMLATVTNSMGSLLDSQKLLYSNAFLGIDADVLYTYGQGGRFEQDVILHQCPPDPASLGLNPQTTCLKMLTASVTPSQPAVNPMPVQTAAGEATDENLAFGSVKMIPGKAFLLGTNQASVRVSKQWIQLNGQDFLVESLPVAAVADGLSALPASAARQSKHGKLRNLLMALHPQRRAMDKSKRKISISRIASPASGLLMDFVTINGGLTNYVFRSDSSYYVSGSGVTLFGTNNIFEGGTVIKFASSGPWTFYSTGPSIEIASSSQVKWPVDQYRPVIFTSKDDNTVGTEITGSTGSPSGYYGDPMLDIVSGGDQTISNFRMAYAEQAAIIDNSAVNFDDGQFVNCLNAVTGGYTSTYLGNDLFANVLTNFDDFSEVTLDAQNVTFSDSDCLWGQSAGAYFTFGLTNCILANVTNLDGFSSSATNIVGAYNGSYASPTVGVDYSSTNANPFQSVGGAGYYLADGSSFRAAGTTNVNPGLLIDLAQKTTYPPVVYDVTDISYLGTLGPDAPRDANASVGSLPDLGYHYPPLDYVFGGCDLNSNLNFTAGTAVGWFLDFGVSSSLFHQPYSLSLDDGAGLSFNGNASQPCIFTRYAMVQEGKDTNWLSAGYMGAIMFNGANSSPVPQLSATFTKWTEDSDWNNFFRDAWAYGSAAFLNCEFYNGTLSGFDLSPLTFTNCLFFRDTVAFWGDRIEETLTNENCTYYNGFLVVHRYTSSTPAIWQIQNSSFDGTAFSWNDDYNGNTNYTFLNFNAYNTSNLSWTNISPSGTNEVVGPNDQMVTNFDWQSGLLGNFYLPPDSPIVDKGSTTANLLGLYWFTTQTNQTIESNNIVDIGYHYPATDANGNPIDTYVPGTPNYISEPWGTETMVVGIGDDGGGNR